MLRFSPLVVSLAVFAFSLLSFFYSLQSFCDAESSATQSIKQELFDSGSGSALSYRDHVAQITAEESHGFEHVFVISLESRTDRRNHMLRLLRPHDLVPTWVPAVPKDGPEVKWILQRLWDSQQGGIGWTPPPGAPSNETWESHYLSTEKTENLYPPPPSETPSLLVGATEGCRPGPIACYASHLRLLRKIVDEDLKGSILILEDDIDLAWDFGDRWSELMNTLKRNNKEWTVIHPGYSWAEELENEAVFHPNLRPSHRPLGTFAYAVNSAASAAPLVESIMHNEAFTLFYLPIDHVLGDFSQTERDLPLYDRTIFTIVPPWVGHGGSKSFTSDVGSEGNGYVSHLADSTRDRLDKYDELQKAAGFTSR